MKFHKMHGTGNDFVVIDARTTERDWPRLAVAMCDRHYGVGADGLLLVLPSPVASYKMRMFNPDGSEAEMCGNGIRCFTKYVIEGDPAAQAAPELSIETLAGIVTVRPQLSDGRVATVRVAMGSPRFRAADIPIRVEPPFDTAPVVDYPIVIEGQELRITAVSMGNPHAVLFVEQPVERFPLATKGPLVEHHHAFPRRVNFEVARVLDRGHIEARVWERGAGMTLACGSGACAIAVAAHLKGLIGNTVDITLPGGTLKVEWPGEGEVFLTGPVAHVFVGEWPE